MNGCLKQIVGNWDQGFAMDKHTASSTYAGDNEYGRPRGPLGKRKISYAKPVFCTDHYPLSVMNGIYPVPA